MKKFLCLLLGLLLLCGCAPQVPETPGGETVSDSYGTEFSLPMKGERIIVLNSSVYEMLCALGCADRVIGVSDNIDYPASALTKEKFGSFRTPSLEKLLEAEPDIVFGSGTRMDADTVAQLQAAGIPVVMFTLSEPEQLQREVAALGRMMQAEEAAAAFCEKVAALHTLIAERTAGLPTVTAYWETYGEYKTGGKDSPIHQMLSLANLQNVAGEEKVAAPQISDEWLLEKDPMLIVKVVAGTQNRMGPHVEDIQGAKTVYQELLARPGWQGMAAMKAGKVLILSGELSTTPLGIAVTPLFLAKAAYPEAFADLDPDVYLDEMLSGFWDTELTGVWSWKPE